MLRFEATTHATDLGVGRVLDRFSEIVTRFQGITERFRTALDWFDVAFITDQTR